MSWPTPSTIDAFWLWLSKNTPLDTSNIRLDCKSILFDDPSYDKTSFIDDIVPSLLVYNIPPPDDDVNLSDRMKSIVALGIWTCLWSALIVINLVGNGAPSGCTKNSMFLFVLWLINCVWSWFENCILWALSEDPSCIFLTAFNVVNLPGAGLLNPILVLSILPPLISTVVTVPKSFIVDPWKL